jgi:hypothetical protein
VCSIPTCSRYALDTLLTASVPSQNKARRPSNDNYFSVRANVLEFAQNYTGIIDVRFLQLKRTRPTTAIGLCGVAVPRRYLHGHPHKPILWSGRARDLGKAVSVLKNRPWNENSSHPHTRVTPGGIIWPRRGAKISGLQLGAKTVPDD